MLITEQNRLEVKPEKSSQLLDLLKQHYGAGTAIFCGPPAADLGFGREKNVFIDMQDLNQVKEHVLSDMVIAVETGITIAELSETLARHDQIFPLDIEEPDRRLIDLIASGDAGYLEQGFGYMRSLVLGLEVAYADGKLAKLGGRVVKNVTGFDLTKLLVGGRGVFGVPYLAHLRLFASPPLRTYFAVTKKSAADLLLMAEKLLRTGLPLAGLELVESGGAGGEGSDGSYQYALIICLMGSDTLVSSLGKQLKETAGQALGELSRQEFLKEYGQLTRPANTGLEISLSKAQAAALIDHLVSLTQRGTIRYRPGMGRFYLDCPDQETMEKTYEMVCQFLKGTKHKTGSNALAEFEQATIAQINGPYKFSSHSPRAGDASFGELVGRLRATFDPHNCFNIGVSFHGK